MLEVQDELDRRLREGLQGGADQCAHLFLGHVVGLARGGPGFHAYGLPWLGEDLFTTFARYDDGAGFSLLVGKEDNDVA